MKIKTKTFPMLILALFFGILLTNRGVPAVLAEENSPENISNETRGSELREERADLERQLQELEHEIEEHQGEIKKYGAQKKTLQNEINSLNSRIKKINLEIKAINLTLEKLSRDIVETQKNINHTENKIDLHKDAISRSLRNIQETDQNTIIEIFLANSNLSDFFNSIENASLVQNSLRTALEEITGLRENLLRQKKDLSIQKSDTEDLKNLRQSQRKTVENTQAEKGTLLKVTKGKESEYQELLKKTKESAAEIRSRIFELLGGGELTFEKAYEYARLAEKATGVRAAVILAVLQRESLLGKNTGRCAYNQKMPGGTTAMNPKDTPVFLSILEKLGIDPESAVVKISCPNQDGTYGGAMGPAQFIPSTWKKFESAIAKITGNNPPNPWNNSDAFFATGLYLQNIGADSKNYSDEKKAAAVYYCGGNWRRNACSYYANRVLETAQKFQKDIDILNS